MRRRFLTLFFLSGCTSLIYELVFYKLLAQVFGSSTLAVTTVLVAFMGGLALGGRLIGARADRTENPIAVYAWLELAIGGYVLIVPLLLRLCALLYRSLGVSADVRDPWHMTLRFVLSVAVLILPTLLMGGTLPLLARALVQSRAGAERELSRLYAVNTFGAAFGTLIANYLLLRYLGIYGTLLLGASANAWIFWRARRLSRAELAHPTAQEFGVDPAADSGTAVHGSATDWFATAGLSAFAVGVVSFMYEVVWTHLLATIVGMSVYAFGLMLATFLAGIALGSALIARFGARATLDRRLLIARLQLALGGFVSFSLPIWDRLPNVFEAVGELKPSFLGMELTRAGVCVAALLLPCIAIGASFPLLLQSAAREPAQLGRRVGLLYALNTLGCIAGALLTGFYLLDRLGSRSLLSIGAALSLLHGFSYCWLVREGRGPRVAFAVGLAGLALAYNVWLFPSWDLRALAAGKNVEFTRGATISEVVWAKEDSQGGFTTVTRERRGLTLRTNGKFQADDHTELAAQQGFALIPLLFVQHYGKALNIGYGSGVTAGVLGRFPFEQIEIAELSPSMVEAADRYFSHINFSAERDARTRFVFNDGRNHLFLSRQQYDLITVEITSIWFAGAASLYGKEFYQSCRQRLTEQGVLQQWVQLHHITPLNLLVIWNTIRSVFPYVSLWRHGTQGALIATLQPQVVNYAHVQAMNDLPSTARLRQRLEQHSIFALLKGQQLDPAAMDEILGELNRVLPEWLVPHAISRDAYPYLEYSTPSGYAYTDTLELENLSWIAGFDRRQPVPIAGVPSEQQQRIEKLARKR